MWGFPKVILPTEVITLLPGVTPVVSRFNLPMEAVTVSIHGLSPPTWSEGVGETGVVPQSGGGNDLVLCHGRDNSTGGLSDLSECHCPFQSLALLPHFWGELLWPQAG